MDRTLPDDESSFVGRGDELALIRRELSAAGLVTLTGPGGVGKTRLARRVAATEAPGGWEGIAWADLAPLGNAGHLAATVADALDLQDHTPRMPTEAIRGWVGPRRVLLVLDSCEHLLAGCRDLVDALLAECPNLRVLATSREPLRTGAESVVRVEPPASTDEALALFADRAQAAGHPLRGDEERRLATALCDGLDRLPLALELAAAQLRIMPLPELCLGPRAAVDLPTSTRRTGLPRHAALRTTIGWSHELCTPVERLLWARLSYLPGRFDAHTARAVARGGPLTADRMGDALAALCDKSVVSERAGTYLMLDTVREYGRMWLAELGETEPTADRHAEHVLAETHRAHTEWFGPRQRDWYGRISFLHADVRLAADRLLTTDPVRALRMVGHLTFFWVCSGYLYEARQYLERAFAQVPKDCPAEIRTQGLWSLGVARTLQGDPEAARALEAQCRRAALDSGDLVGLAAAAYLRGLLHLLEGRPLSALTVVDEALRTIGTPGEGRPAAASAMCRLVRVFALTATGSHDRARREALDLRGVCVAAQEYWTRSYLDHQLALIALMEGHAKDAVEHARSVLAAKRFIGDDFGIAMAMDVLALAQCDAGEDRSAAYAFGAALRYWASVGHPQRGTPEMALLRDECEARLAGRLGETEYAGVLEKAAGLDARALLAWASVGGPPPGE
ncbi:NB-ARC domain-containing protein [Streptomyces sp. NPDC000983]|uniref:ATP-binding protein n=1 Tax=Streptomyces sp. NPDC000983 TaxID=3154373 RepID=UPI00331892D8